MMTVNRRLLDRATALAPAEAAALLVRWGRMHWVRTLLGIVGLLILLVSNGAR
ncbi:MAG TPA: hypothetical protein VKS22_08030 [Candidatus Binataceae bacterium]|nr:hypothetical protein [Candidatus Binataceae bacterium]